MATRDTDIDIVTGAQAVTKETADTDGDGVSDIEENLAGTDAGDATDFIRAAPVVDASGEVFDDLDPNALAKETVFDKTVMPEGTSVDTGLTGLTNLDGSALKGGPNHLGIGEDSILEGHNLGGLDVQRNPLAPAEGMPVGTSDTGGHAPGATPPGVTNKWDLVSAGKEPTKFTEHPIDYVVEAVDNMFKGESGGGGTDPGEKTAKVGDPIEKKPVKPVVPGSSDDYDTNPDADQGITMVTGEDLQRIVAVRGGDTDVIEGGPPKIDASSPPENPRGRGVTDPVEGGDEIVDVGSMPLGGRPDAPVVQTLNPDLGVTQLQPTPQPHGTGGDDIGGFGQPDSSSNAATAVYTDEPPAPELTAAGSSGTIQTVDDGAAAADGGGDAMAAFSAEYLEDVPADTLGADLSADLTVVDSALPEPDELSAQPLDEPGPPPVDELDDGLGDLSQ